MTRMPGRVRGKREAISWEGLILTSKNSWRLLVFDVEGGIGSGADAEACDKDSGHLLFCHFCAN